MAAIVGGMTDEEVAELIAENERLRALSEPESTVIVEAPETPPVEEVVAVIEAETERTVAIIEAETARDVAIIEATAEAEAPPESTGTGNAAGSAGAFAPESDHWYFKTWKGRK